MSQETKQEQFAEKVFELLENVHQTAIKEKAGENITNAKKEEVMKAIIEKAIAELAPLYDDVTTSDLQGIVEARAMQIVKDVFGDNDKLRGFKSDADCQGRFWR